MLYLAERAGFEPARELLLYTLSRRACSAAPAPLHIRKPMAERAGFEPATRIRSTAFREPRLRPLGHLSGQDNYKL